MSGNLKTRSMSSVDSSDTYSGGDKTTYIVMWTFIIFLLLFVIAAFIVAMVAVYQSGTSLPDTIDIVIIEQSGTANRGTTKQQSIAIASNMGFRNNIFILTPNHPTGNATPDTTVSNCYYVNFTPVGTTPTDILNSYFLEQQNIQNLSGGVPNIAANAIFLSDMTFPFSTIYESYFYTNVNSLRPTMFNFFRDASEQAFLAQYYNHTVPTMVQTMSLFSGTAGITLEQYVMFEITQQRATLNNAINRDVLVDGDAAYVNNVEIQFNNLNNNTPMFATFHITGATPDAVAAATTATAEYLTTKFK